MSGEFHPRDFRRGLRGVKLSAQQYRVAVELSEYSAIGKAIVWPSIATLAADCGVGRSTVIRALNRLLSVGVIASAGSRAGGRGRATRWQLLIKGVTPDTVSNGERVSSATERVSFQTVKGVSRDTRSSKEVDKEGEGARASAALLPPSRTCPKHINDPNPPNCHACGNAREAAEAFAAEHAKAENQARADARARRDACRVCEGTNWIPHTEPAVKCNHQEAV